MAESTVSPDCQALSPIFGIIGDHRGTRLTTIGANTCQAHLIGRNRGISGVGQVLDKHPPTLKSGALAARGGLTRKIAHHAFTRDSAVSMAE